VVQAAQVKLTLLQVHQLLMVEAVVVVLLLLVQEVLVAAVRVGLVRVARRELPILEAVAAAVA
jgi:hypothetical protein